MFATNPGDEPTPGHCFVRYKDIGADAAAYDRAVYILCIVNLPPTVHKPQLAMLTRTHSAFLLIAVLLVAPGCYHATVVTGKQASNQVVEELWAHSFIYGLVPPETIDVAEQCPNGVAMVETQLSFLNLVANAVTFGIYTPMTITATCASGASAAVMPAPSIEFDGITISRSATDAGINRAFYAAALRAAETGEPVAVRFVR